MGARSWKTDPSVFPCELSEETTAAAVAAVEAAVLGWGKKSVPELEAEERLVFACEKAPTEDPVLLGVSAFCMSVLIRFAIVFLL